MRVGPGVWIVEWPREDGDIAAIHYVSSLASLELKFKCDLKAENIAGVFTTSEEANQYSIDLMAAFNRGREATK